MTCSCGQENPASNKFCGGCGGKLHTAAIHQPSITSPLQGAAEPVGRERTAFSHDDVDEASYPNADRGFSSEWLANEDLRSLGIDRPPQAKSDVEARESQPAVLSVESSSYGGYQYDTPPSAANQISGPSFLGLSGGGQPDYLFDEETESGGRGKWVVLLILALAIGAGAWKWELVRGWVQQRIAQSVPAPPQPKTIAAENAPPASPESDTATTPNTQSATTADTSPSPQGLEPSAAQNSASAASPTEPTKGTEPGAVPEVAANAAKKTEPPISAASPTSAASPKAVENQEANVRSDAKSSAGQASSAAKISEKPAPVEEKKVATSAAAPKLAASKQGDLLLQTGEQFFYGRGVAKSCQQALTYFRAAADQENSKALSHLGAMYATGQCVPQNRTLAYGFFARAADSDRSNVWLQRNMEMLWRDMNSTERQAVLKP